MSVTPSTTDIPQGWTLGEHAMKKRFFAGLLKLVIFNIILSPLAWAATINIPADFTAIQAGIDAANDGDTVLVAPGTYTENIDFKGKAIILRSAQGAATTIIDGGGKFSSSIGVAFHLAEDYASVLDGFTITNSETAVSYGITNASGPPYPASASPVIINNIFFDNFYGIGGYVNYHTNAIKPYIVGNIFDANYCGIYIDKQAYAYGGVNAVIRNNTFVNNSNCGIKLRMHTSLPVINSNIFANNGTGIDFVYLSSLEERKALIWYNSFSGNTTDINSEGTAVNMIGIQGNISSPPIFVDAGNQDYHLQNGSPAIDSGDPDPAYNDSDGSRNDMGAFGGPLNQADTTPPQNVTIISSSPSPSVASNDNTVKVIWEQPFDIEFGVAGYSFIWDTNPTTDPDTIVETRAAVTATTSLPLADGNNHYFHIRAVDKSHNWGASSHIGPFIIDTSLSTTPIYQAITLPPATGYDSSSFYGINESGKVTGKFSNYDLATDKDIDRQGIVWDPLNGATLLPSLSGETVTWAISDSHVVGYSYTASGMKHAVRWDNNGSGFTVQDLGTLFNTEPQPDGQWGDNSEARAVNNFGTVTGWSEIPNDDGSFIPYHAYRHTQQAGMQDLGTLRTDAPQWQNGYSIGYYVSDQEKTVGVASSAYAEDWAFYPFIHNPATGIKPLSINPDYPLNQWSGTVLDNHGMIGGYMVAGTDQSIPYYWTDEYVNEPIPMAMPAAFPYGEIYGINNQGQMVGMMWNSSGQQHAFLWDITHGTRDLNDISILNPGDVLEAAIEINDSGQIVGKSSIGGEQRGFLLTLYDPAETPSVPQNLVATSISDAQIDLSWDTSTDNIAVTGYRVFRNGSEITTTSSNTFSDTGLVANTTYHYRVSAYDADSNQSNRSNLASATTGSACNGNNVVISTDFQQQTPVLCEATGSISTLGTVNITPGADVTFRAVTGITLNSGFAVKALGIFRAGIQ